MLPAGARLQDGGIVTSLKQLHEKINGMRGVFHSLEHKVDLVLSPGAGCGLSDRRAAESATFRRSLPGGFIPKVRLVSKTYLPTAKKLEEPAFFM